MIRSTIRCFVGVGILAGILGLGAGTGRAPTAATEVSAAPVAQTYIVLYSSNNVPSSAEKTIANAGGTLVYSYGAIGVAIASSSDASFATRLAAAKGVEGVSATGAFATQIETDFATETVDTAGVPVTDSNEPLFGLQWDMRQIHTPEAHLITGGSPTVIVGDLDTGLDWTHPDLAPNVDFTRSVSCEGGVPNQAPAAWMDHNGHGTHTAGTIAAAANGIGIVGVAPNVKIAGIKTSNDDGYFFPEAVVCAFVWAAEHGIHVTNNSYFADPWLFNCRNDAEQRAIWKAEQRAIRYAMSKGVVVVAAEGNENIDLTYTATDTISPDFPPGSEEERIVKQQCLVIPVEIPGVIGVTANGNLMQKSYYSSYGIATADVVAPGGDRRFQVTAAATNGRVLSTWPTAVGAIPGLTVVDNGALYVYLQGTSMASPHVAGVAALIRSEFPHLTAAAVVARIGTTADPVPCPPNPFNPGPPFAFEAWCTGGPTMNSFYGQGQVNALSAITP